MVKRGIVNEDGSRLTQPQSGTPQGGVISPLLSNFYLHVVFDGWMLQHYPGIRFEWYADDIIIHARREQIAQSILQKLQVRFTQYGLSIHLTKKRIVCLTRSDPGLAKLPLPFYKTRPEQPLECMPMLLIVTIILKSCPVLKKVAWCQCVSSSYEPSSSSIATMRWLLMATLSCTSHSFVKQQIAVKLYKVKLICTIALVFNVVWPSAKF